MFILCEMQKLSQRSNNVKNVTTICVEHVHNCTTMDKKFQSLIEYVEHKFLVKATMGLDATWKEKRVAKYNHDWGTQKEIFTSKSFIKHYFEWPLCLPIHFSEYILHLILTFFVIEVVVIVCDLDDLNMSLNVLEHI